MLTLALTLLALAQDPDQVDQLSAAARISFPGGTLTENTRWKDVLGVGDGADVSYAHLWHAGPQCHLGLFGNFGFDDFSGKRSSIIGGTIEPDGLSTFYLEAGPRFRLDIDNVFLDADLGFGEAFYGAENATVTVGGGSAKLKAVKSSSGYVFDGGGRIGLRITKQAEIFFGVKWQLSGAPKSAITGINYEKMQDVVLDVGLQVNF